MPINPQATGAGQAIALEGQAIEAEIARLAAQRQTIAASNDMVAPVPERFRQAVAAAKVRLNQAETAWTRADQQARLRIRQANPSEALQKVWYEQDTIAAHNERERAKAALVDAELALGREVQYQREYEAAKAAAPGLHAQIDQECREKHDAVDRDLLLKQTRRAT